MYAINSLAIVIILFVFILGANEIGIRIGEYYEKKTDDDVKSQTTAIQGGIIGILALILGFTFNMSLARYDNRAAAEIAEANAIGTAILRTSLLPSPFDEKSRQLIEQYIDLRLAVNQTDLTHNDIRKDYNKQTANLQSQIWQTGIDAADQAPNPVKTGYFIQAINDMIDAQGRRNDQL